MELPSISINAFTKCSSFVLCALYRSILNVFGKISLLSFVIFFNSLFCLVFSDLLLRLHQKRNTCTRICTLRDELCSCRLFVSFELPQRSITWLWVHIGGSAWRHATPSRPNICYVPIADIYICVNAGMDGSRHVCVAIGTQCRC